MISSTAQIFCLGSPSQRALRFIMLLLIAGAVCRARAKDWPRWRGPDLNGVSLETGWSIASSNEGPRQIWKASVGIGFSSVTIANGRAFTIGNTDATDTVFCLDANTGKQLWKHSYPCPLDDRYYEGGPGSTPTIDGDRVYTLSKRGHLFCFNAVDGNVIWQKDLMTDLKVTKPQWGFASSPFVDGDRLILNLGGAGTAVDKKSGKVLWCSELGAAGYATPVPINRGQQRAFAIFSAKALLAVRADDGQVLWTYPWETRWDISAADPLWIGDRLFISTFDRGCALLDLNSGKPKPIWQNKNVANHFNSCVFVNGYIYGVHGNTDQAERDLRCLDPNTGDIQWKYTGLGLGSLMAADGKLIVLSDRGELVIAEANPQAFKPLARAQVLGGKCWTVPVLANGKLYCRNAQGTLVCLEMK